MGFKTVLGLPLIAAAAFVAARKIVDEPQRVEALPEPLRRPAQALRSRLLRVDAHVREGIRAGKLETHAAEAELTAEFHRKARS